MKTYIHKKLCTRMFIALFFIIVPKLKVPKFSSTGYVHGFLLNSKKEWTTSEPNSMDKLRTCWVKEANIHYMIPFIWSCRTDKINPLVLEDCGLPWVGAGVLDWEELQGTVWGYLIVLHLLLSGDLHKCIQLTKRIESTPKKMCFIVCKLYPPKIFFFTLTPFKRLV